MLQIHVSFCVLNDVLRLDLMLRELRKLLCYDKHGCFFLEKCVRTAAKTMVVDRKKTEGTSSARFGLRAAAKCGELKRCADQVGSRTDNKYTRSATSADDVIWRHNNVLLSNGGHLGSAILDLVLNFPKNLQKPPKLIKWSKSIN